MSRVIRHRWTSDFAAPTRQGNRSCEYEAYVPDLLVGRNIMLDGDVAADVADAESAIVRLNVAATSLIDTEALARILLRAESVASSKIEGLEVGARRLLRAETARGLGEAPSDVTALEVLGNIDAMVAAIRSADEGKPITIELLLDLHRRLLAGTRLEAHGGHLREVQNWIGGSDYNPCSAAFVPAPPEFVEQLMVDLVAFANSDRLPAVAQAAVAHAQFETIHPFIDGNGRTGRALIHLILRRRGLAPRVLPPVSLILATWAKDYVGGLEASRYHGPSTTRAAHEGTNMWIGRFAGACTRAAADATSFEHRAQAIEATWRDQLDKVRDRSATDLLLRALVGAPVLTVNSAADLIGRSFVQTNQAVARLVEAGILKQVTVGRRNRAFEAADIIDAFTDLERQLGSPAGDIRASEPIRLAARHTDEPTRQGEVLEVRGANGEPPHLVRWADGHTGLMYPGPGSVLRVEAEHLGSVPAETTLAGAVGLAAGVVEPQLPHVREWQVRVSIFESGDDTSANVVLLSEAPTHLSARGQSHRGTADPSVPEIGDEVAVARALRHLADQLLQTAAQDVEAVTGENPHLLPS